ncbi:hypothetical protein ACWEV4_19665 [Streptomyces sp. NPDC003860]
MASRINNHLIPLLGEVALRDIDASTLRTFKATLLTRVEDSTAEVIWGHLSSILNSAVDDQRLLRNPLKVHKSVKAPRAKEKKAKAWARTTVDAVREHLQERYRFAVDLGLGLGLRQGEAFGLAEEDFDFTNMVVRIRRQLRWDTKGRPYFCLPKGGKTREVPLSPQPGGPRPRALPPFLFDGVHSPLAEPGAADQHAGGAAAASDHRATRPHHLPREPDLLQDLERAELAARPRGCRAAHRHRREDSGARRPGPPLPRLRVVAVGHVPRPAAHLRQRAVGGR